MVEDMFEEVKCYVVIDEIEGQDKDIKHENNGSNAGDCNSVLLGIVHRGG